MRKIISTLFAIFALMACAKNMQEPGGSEAKEKKMSILPYNYQTTTMTGNFFKKISCPGTISVDPIMTPNPIFDPSFKPKVTTINFVSESGVNYVISNQDVFVNSNIGFQTAPSCIGNNLAVNINSIEKYNIQYDLNTDGSISITNFLIATPTTVKSFIYRGSSGNLYIEYTNINQEMLRCGGVHLTRCSSSLPSQPIYLKLSSKIPLEENQVYNLSGYNNSEEFFVVNAEKTNELKYINIDQVCRDLGKGPFKFFLNIDHIDFYHDFCFSKEQINFLISHPVDTDFYNNYYQDLNAAFNWNDYLLKNHWINNGYAEGRFGTQAQLDTWQQAENNRLAEILAAQEAARIEAERLAAEEAARIAAEQKAQEEAEIAFSSMALNKKNVAIRNAFFEKTTHFKGGVSYKIIIGNEKYFVNAKIINKYPDLFTWSFARNTLNKRNVVINTTDSSNNLSVTFKRLNNNRIQILNIAPFNPKEGQLFTLTGAFDYVVDRRHDIRTAQGMYIATDSGEIFVANQKEVKEKYCGDVVTCPGPDAMYLAKGYYINTPKKYTVKNKLGTYTTNFEKQFVVLSVEHLK